MVHVPLIPNTKNPDNFDVSHILQEAFQDFIDPDEFCQNVTKNVCKYNLDNANLKKTGEEVIATYDGTKLSMDDIARTEHQLMVSQAQYLKRKVDVTLSEGLKLKRQDVFEDLDVHDVAKHQLLHKTDLLPSKPEISMDFRLNSNRHLCELPCESPTEVIDEVDQRETCISEPSQFQTKVKSNKREHKPKLQVIFKAEPSVLEFLEYRVGVTYEKKFKLRNVTKCTRTFIPCSPKNSHFKVELYSGVTRVASGMFVVFLVKYRTDIYKDVEETITIKTFTGKDVIVTFKSYRTPPRLLAFVYRNLEHFQEKCQMDCENDLQYSEERQLALNSSIDCGGCLVGTVVEVNIIIKNEGSDGKFFLLSEDEWYFSEVTFRHSAGELVLGSFVISPTYFEIKRNEFIELRVRFTSEEFGLAVEKLFLLCDNNTVEELEIIADGVLFDKTSVLIDSGFSKKKFDAKCNFVLNYQQCLPNYEYIRFVTVYNNSCLNYNYKWGVRDTISHVKGLMFDKLSVDWISIKNPPPCLYSNTITDFEIVLCCPVDVTGVHRLALILHVVDIPETSIANDVSFCILEKPKEELLATGEPQVFDIVIGEIEVVANFIAITIAFDPPAIKITNKIEINSSIKQKIQLTSLIDIELEGEWTVSNENILEVYPSEITLLPHVVYTCDVRIQIRHYEDVNETITFKVLNSAYKKQFDVHVKVVQPKAKFSTNSLLFGVIPKGQTAPSKTIYIQNTGFETIEWSILECSYDFSQEKVIYFDSSRHLSVNKGLLPTGETCAITYTVDSIAEDCRWVSFLVLLSIHPTQLAMDSACIITYEVAEPNIKIHSALSNFPLICPGQLLYLGCQTQYQLCVHNVGKNLSGGFTFGVPQGQHTDNLDVTFNPKSGVVCPEMCIHIVMTITPLQAGVVDDFQIPCHVECANNPICLTFMCVVDDIHVKYYLPNIHDKFTIVFWPPNSFPDAHATLSDITNRITEDISQCMLDECEINEIVQRNSLMNSQVDSINDFELTSDFKLSIESISVQEFPVVVQSSSTSQTSQFSLKDYFTGHLELHQHSIEFKSVPLRTPVKKTIVIENVTPILGDFHICTTNFYPVYPADTRERLFQQLLEEVNIKPKSDEWDEFVNTKYGIMVKCAPTFGFVSCSDTFDVNIWVYANTWGAYIEEVIIYLNDIEPFHFNLLIEAVGIPFEYPISLNSILKETVIRFGAFPYLSESRSRTLKIKNYSCIPLNVVWHTFLVGGHPTNFNLIMESFNHSFTSNSSDDTEMSMKLLITNKYHGIQDNLIFQVSPTSVRLKPKATKELRITFDPKTVDAKLENTNLEGVLIGYIHLTNKYKFQSDVFVRKTDIEIAPAKVKLLATLELPLLELQLLEGDLKIGAFANDIIEAEEIRYERRLIFRNTHNAVAEVSMNINEPFKVVNLTTVHAKTDKAYYAASVPHDYCLQVLIVCVMDSEQVLRYSDMIFNSKTTMFPEIVNFDDKSIVIKRNLEIHQSGVKMQVVPMEFTIFYPSLEVSQKTLAFDVVFIGNTKRSLLTLFNTSGNAIPFTVHKSPYAEVFQIVPASGTVPKSNGRVAASVTLNVYFTPSESRKYQETIRVASNIPFLHVNVILTGGGTHDERFYVEGV